MRVKSILSFDKMIMPLFIKIIFWIGVIGAVLFGFGWIIFGFIKFKNGGFGMVIGGIFLMLIGPFIVRLYAEMLIVIFKLQESLIQIRNLLSENKVIGETYVETPDKIAE